MNISQEKCSLIIEKIILLPIEKLTKDGKIDHIAFAGDDNLYITYKDKIYFFDLEGNLEKNKTRKLLVAIVPDQNTVLSYNYFHVKHPKLGKVVRLVFTYHNISNGQLNPSNVTFEVYLQQFFNMTLSDQSKLFFVKTSYGLSITHYTEKSWVLAGFVDQKLLKEINVKASFGANVSKNICFLVHEKQNTIVVYDYEKEQEIDQLELISKALIQQITFVAAHNYLVVHQEDGIVVFDIETKKEMLSIKKKIISFDAVYDFIMLIDEQNVLEVYSLVFLKKIGECQYFQNTPFPILYKLHESEPKMVVTNGEEAIILKLEVSDEVITKDKKIEEKCNDLYQRIETWDSDEIDTVLYELKELNRTNKREKLLIQRYLDVRYQTILEKGLNKKTLRSLKGLLIKWQKMNINQKQKMLNNWNYDIPFFLDKIDGKKV